MSGPLSHNDVLAAAIAGLSKEELQDRQQDLQRRLEEIQVVEPSKKRPRTTTDIYNTVPVILKTDTHWDFCMKEMMWLAADFQSERKRQLTMGKKLTTSIQGFHTSKETRWIRELAEAELKRRRLAGKIGREVRGWWTKIERVTAYKQKIEVDKERRQAMNQQLVDLIKQTERYGQSLTIVQGSDQGGYRMTIEEALSESYRRGQRIQGTTDYTRVSIAKDDNEIYGESTEDSGSDGSFVLGSEPDDDDETTIREAEESETQERRLNKTGNNDDCTSYKVDPDEMHLLYEESLMDVNLVLERMKKVAESLQDCQGDHTDVLITDSRNEKESKRVLFAPDFESEVEATSTIIKQDPGNDADDDADASDVEDFNNSDGSEEFVGDLNVVDDETTIEAEERLDREISVADEISMLKREGEMSVEELRKLFAIPANAAASDDTIEKAEISLGDNSEVNSESDEKSSVQDADINDETFTNVNCVEDNDEYKPNEMEVDDETTLEAEERLGQDMSAKEEINLLQKEGEIPVEQLRAMYTLMETENFNGDYDRNNGEGTKYDKENANAFESNDINDISGTNEFQPDNEISNKITREAKLPLTKDLRYKKEFIQHKKGSEIPVEGLLIHQRIPRTQGSGVDKDDSELFTDEFSTESGDDDGSEEFVDEENLVDDETTMEIEEQMGREISVKDEIDMLEREGEMSIDELRFMYGHSIADCNEGNSESTSRSRCKLKHRANTSKSPTQSKTEDKGLIALQSLQEMENKLRKTLATRPFLLSSWVHMREYQQIGLNWLVSMQCHRLNGILADEMGLGKTLQTIALLAYLAAYKGIWGPHLVIVPTSCIVNWETEIKRFCPAMKVLCYYGAAKRRKELRTGWTKSNWHHVVVTSYQLVVQDAFAFKRKKWYYLILDEAQNIKNFQSQRWQTLINFNTQRRLLLTGTPLQNNLMELWSLLHFLMPHVFRSRKEFSYWFSNPMNNIIEGNTSRSDDLISRLHGIIRPFVLRRLKKDVESQMPGKYEHIVKVQMSRRQMFLYEEFMARSSTRTALNTGGNFMGMMNVLMQLRKVCNHPDLFEPRSVITPFAMERIRYTVPRLVLFMSSNDQLFLPLWSINMGLPSPEQCVPHDQLEHDQLLRITIKETDFVRNTIVDDLNEPNPDSGMSVKLTNLLVSIRVKECETRLATRLSQGKVSARRCSTAAFPYPLRLLERVQLEVPPIDRPESEMWHNGRIISTPSELLAAKRSHADRVDDLDELMRMFVFCVPRAGTSAIRLDGSFIDRKAEALEHGISEMLLEPLEEYFAPFRSVQARLSSFFPDKKLVQFDAGKLQTLSVLLRDLKQGGHRALIFTQMSKMLDTLEAFLNLNGHTYLRLDGSTGIDRRQRLMDKFNNDEKIFCFILSTRSGGLGINLTGADTVIFYDSDWNPAMDAQAQDRAHRIGQTRDVHIYRLITEHSIEENIWIKAKQKRNLDLIVMDEGKFDAGHTTPSHQTREDENIEVQDVYTKGGLREILGIESDVSTKIVDLSVADQGLTKDQIEKAMVSLEDEEDAVAMVGAQKEADQELQEFDENIDYTTECDGDDDRKNARTDSNEKVVTQSKDINAVEEEDILTKVTEDEMVKEFEAWQKKVGMDSSSIESSLGPTERYGLFFRESIDPFWSNFAISENKRKLEAIDDEEDIDIDELERVKAIEEQQAMDDGDLLATHPPPEDLLRQRNVYFRERSRLRSDRKRRKLTGKSWITKTDGISQLPYWYNEDTGEAVWEKPKLLLELEGMESAQTNGWNAMPTNPLVHLMEYLIPYPDRTNCSTVCQHWRHAAQSISFVRHVFPVEMGALTQGGRKLEHNHYRTIAEVMEFAQPGDTIELGDGHYWINEPGLTINIPLRFIGDENDPSHVVIELSGSIRWQAKSGWIEGITVRRPRISKEGRNTPEILVVEDGGQLDIIHSVLNNEGSLRSPAIVRGYDSKANWTSVILRGAMISPGLIVEDMAEVELRHCTVSDNGAPGIVCRGKSRLRMTQCRVERNLGSGVYLGGNSRCEISKCRFSNNAGGPIDKEIGSICAPCNGNSLIVASHKVATPKLMPGFRVIRDQDQKVDEVSSRMNSTICL